MQPSRPLHYASMQSDTSEQKWSWTSRLHLFECAHLSNIYFRKETLFKSENYRTVVYRQTIVDFNWHLRDPWRENKFEMPCYEDSEPWKRPETRHYHDNSSFASNRGTWASYRTREARDTLYTLRKICLIFAGIWRENELEIRLASRRTTNKGSRGWKTLSSSRCT